MPTEYCLNMSKLNQIQQSCAREVYEYVDAHLDVAYRLKRLHLVWIDIDSMVFQQKLVV